MNVRFQGVAFFRGANPAKVQERAEAYMQARYERGVKYFICLTPSDEPLLSRMKRKLLQGQREAESVVIDGPDFWRFTEPWGYNFVATTEPKIFWPSGLMKAWARKFAEKSSHQPGVQIHREDVNEDTLLLA